MTQLATATSDIDLKVEQLSLPQLLEVACTWAPRIEPDAGAGQPSDRRWYKCLERNDVYEVGLSGWDADQSNEFHDHGGSQGAVIVVSGSLIEKRVSARNPVVRERVLTAGNKFTFTADIIHDVTNAGTGPSMSVHVYSPPISTMTYYDVDGGLSPKKTIECTNPEPDAIILD